MSVDTKFVIAFYLIGVPLMRIPHFVIFGVAVALMVISLITAKKLRYPINRKIGRALGLIGTFLMVIALIVIPVMWLLFSTPFSAGVIELLKRMTVFAIVCMPIVIKAATLSKAERREALDKIRFLWYNKENEKEGMNNVSKYFYYVGVRTSDGLALVTSVNNIDRFAFWDVNEKPLAMSRAMANDYAERLCMNSFTAVVIKSFFELNKHFVPDEKKCADI